MPIFLLNKQGEISLKVVEEVCRVAKESYNCQLLVIDHLHYFASDSNNRTSEVTAISRAIKNMAMELDLPVLLLAHLNR
jgi:replicative DNA helicase